MATAMRKITIPIKDESTGTTTNEEYTFVTPEEMDRKADIDGYYVDLTSGTTEQLISSQYVEDSVPYLYRTTGGSADVGNREYMESIVGGTVAWNQLIQNGDFSNGINGWYKASGNISVSNGEAEITIGGAWNNDIRQTRNIYNGHVYFMRFSVKADDALSGNVRATLTAVAGTSITASTPMLTTSYQTREYIDKCRADQGDIRITLSDNASAYIGQKYYTKNVNLIDLTQMFGSAIADYIYSLEQANAGAGVAWFEKLFKKPYYAYDAGTLKSVEGLQSHDMVGFNAWDEEWEVGSISDSTGANETSASIIRSKNYIPVIPNTTYYAYVGSGAAIRVFYYDAEQNFISYENTGSATFTTPSDAHYMRFRAYQAYGTTYKNDICINLSLSGWRNGEYEPYQKHSYPLDSSLVLRGIPKLDAQNNLYYDGDTYEADGTVDRKYGIVDLGTLNYTTWGSSDSRDVFTPSSNIDITPITSPDKTLPAICPKFSAKSYNATWVHWDMAYLNNGGNIGFVVPKSTYDRNTFKSAMSGVYLVYELATPTTEQAEPFQEVQICDDFGTEEFVTTSIVPVGHNTNYPANLRDKLQHLPNLADADGYYMIKQTDKQMSLEHFRIPKAPTEDGDYVLRAHVSGGTPTYAWESEAVENG